MKMQLHRSFFLLVISERLGLYTFVMAMIEVIHRISVWTERGINGDKMLPYVEHS